MKQPLILLAFGIILFSLIKCTVDSQPVQKQESSFGMETILGKKLPNPYSLENMQNAASLLKRAELKSNKLYVRFLPKNADDANVLISAGLNVVDHPLDYEIKQYGNYYIDPERKGQESQWVYAVVDANFRFNNDINYEILSELYIPETLDLELENEAFKLVGLPFSVNEQSDNQRAHVGGTLLYDGDPLPNVEVTAREWFRFETRKTDMNGKFTMSYNYYFDTELSIRFVNDNEEFRRFDVGNLIMVLFPSTYYLGVYNPNYIPNKIFEFETSNNIDLRMNAQAYNSLQDFKSFATEGDNLFDFPTTKLNIWMARNTSPQGSAAPMLRAMASATWNNIVSILENYLNIPNDLAASLAGILNTDVVPDLFLSYNVYNGVDIGGSYIKENSERIWYHEYAHASHFAQAGADLWLPYIQHILEFGAYGSGTDYSSGIPALSESWAEDVAQACYFWKKGVEATNREHAGPSSGQWIPYGIYYDLIDDNNSPYESDDVSGFTLTELYNYLESTVASPAAFKAALLADETDPVRVTAIEALFTDYSY